ncbi:MAG: Iron-sulfur cluster insertion protein ErpA [Planctomycetes bacterium]|nr:Iron-sulfur cluster insertion protein ErpA [Planctomycetota bacterium]
MSATTPSLAFTITDQALEEIRGVMSKQNLAADEKNLRVFAESGGGCCGGGGVGFGLAFDKVQPDDVTVERGGLTVVIDPMSAPYVNGVTIDFVRTPEVTGFKVTGPMMKQGGGCGTSSGGCGSGGGGGCGSGGCGCGTGQGSGACGTGGGHSHGQDHGHDHAHGGHDHSHGDHGHSHGGCGSKSGSGGGCC